MNQFQVPAWVNKRQSHGSVELLGRSIVVSLDEAEWLGERIAILMMDGQCDEESSQRHVLTELMILRKRGPN